MQSAGVYFHRSDAGTLSVFIFETPNIDFMGINEQT